MTCLLMHSDPQELTCCHTPARTHSVTCTATVWPTALILEILEGFHKGLLFLAAESKTPQWLQPTLPNALTHLLLLAQPFLTTVAFPC